METADNLKLSGISHGFFGREGGVSEGIYDSRNCGFGSGDMRNAVAANRRSVAEQLGTTLENLVTPYQTHSAIAVYAGTSWSYENAPKADAVVTDIPGLAVGVLTADCVPVLFADDKARIVAAAHSGWRGAIGGVLESAVAKMSELGANMSDLKACVGPAISVDAYEVGEAFQKDFLQRDPESAQFFQPGPDGATPHLDLPAYVVHRLKTVGITDVSLINHCTAANESRYFSYRRAVKRQEPDYGRQISAIMLQ